MIRTHVITPSAMAPGTKNSMSKAHVSPYPTATMVASSQKANDFMNGIMRARRKHYNHGRT